MHARRWGGVPGGAGGGILRRRREAAAAEDEEVAQLLVFGYSCKLFRDDERALHLELGRHLIPCMADPEVLIDRYDARGALGAKELAAAEGRGDPRLGWERMTPEERRAEKLCDEERYRALHCDEDEQEMYKEEELKRMHLAQSSKYGQVAFDYGSSAPTDSQTSEDPNDEDEPFVPHPSLGVPEGMALPDTKKLNKIVEKTAFFIASQDTQMEILLKAKQSGNPNFEFLSLQCPLHPYYCFLLTAIKEGRYKSESHADKEAGNEEDDHYLHPSLASMAVESAPSIPSIAYKPSADCAYSMLVNEIKGTGEAEAQGKEASDNTELAPPGTESTPPANPEEQYYNPALQAEYAQMYGQHPYYSAYNYQEIGQAPVLYDTAEDLNPSCNEIAQIGLADSTAESKPIEPPKADNSNATGLKLIHYSDSEEEDEDDSTGSTLSNPQLLKIPPPAQQSIIDKMASYVARNGNDFEQIVRMKGDPRFSFLDETHEFHPYYKHKRRFYEASKKPSDTGNNETVSTVAANSQNKKKYFETRKKIIAPVSFSIKKIKEVEPVLPKPALPYESSEDDENDSNEIAEEPSESIVTPITEIVITQPHNPPPEVKSMLPIEPPKLELRPKLFNQYIYQIQPTVPPKVQVAASENKSKSSIGKRRDSDKRRSRSKSPRNSQYYDDYKRKRRKKRYRSDEEEDAPSGAIKIDESSEGKKVDQFIDLTNEIQDDGLNADGRKNNDIQSERKRKAAAFLSSLKAVPTAPVEQHNSLASAMVKTLHSLQSKDEESSSRRKRRDSSESRSYKRDHHSGADSWRHSSRSSYSRSRSDYERHRKSRNEQSSRDRSPDFAKHSHSRKSKYSPPGSPKTSTRKSKSREKSPTNEYTTLKNSLEYRKTQKQNELLTASLKELVRETRKDLIQAQPIKMAVDIFSNDVATASSQKTTSDDEWERDSNEDRGKSKSENASDRSKSSPEGI